MVIFDFDFDAIIRNYTISIILQYNYNFDLKCQDAQMSKSEPRIAMYFGKGKGVQRTTFFIIDSCC